MKVIFLDIDGVLNGFAEYTAPAIPSHEWDPSVMQRCGIRLEIHEKPVRKLNRLLTKSGAKIVLTTSWRKGDDIWYFNLLQTLEHSGLLPVIIDKTPSLIANRGDEVQAWLDEHPEVTHFCIFDDINEFPNLLDKFVHTDYQLGIQDKDIEKAEKLLDC